jgi:hypothetical protein
LLVRIEFSEDRCLVGSLQVFDDAGVLVFGPLDCLGRADSQDALLHGNPARDSTRPFGDTPTGDYQPVQLVTHSNGESDLHMYGSYPSLLLDPISGDALQSRVNGRSGLMIHGGTSASNGALRPTHGCVRLSEDNQRNLVSIVPQSALRSSLVTIEEPLWRHDPPQPLTGVRQEVGGECRKPMIAMKK